jgi:hypothetical protein
MQHVVASLTDMEVAPQTQTHPRREPTHVAEREVVYPDSDGKPMADDTLQFDWIVRLRENLDAFLPDFVAGDLLWYPVEGNPAIRVAPDVMVCLGRPKGYRGSYMQFREDGVPPAVVFEVLSPSNKPAEMMRKAAFYAKYGVSEFVVIDPMTDTGYAHWLDASGDYAEADTLDGWTSPLLGIRFERTDGGLQVYRPDGTRFLDFREVEERSRAAEARAENAEARAENAEARAENAEARAEEEAQQKAIIEARAARLAAKLAALGISADDL